MLSIKIRHSYKSIFISNIIVKCQVSVFFLVRMSSKCYPLGHVAHIMPGATRLPIEMDNMVNVKMKSNMDQNKNNES